MKVKALQYYMHDGPAVFPIDANAATLKAETVAVELHFDPLGGYVLNCK